MTSRVPRAVALLLLLGATSSGQEGRQLRDLETRLGEVLSTFDVESARPARVAAAVLELEREVAPVLFEVLASGRTPAVPASGPRAALSAERLGTPRAEGLLLAAQRFGRDSFIDQLEALVGSGADWKHRRAALSVLAKVAQPSDLELAVRLLEVRQGQRGLETDEARAFDDVARTLFEGGGFVFRRAHDLFLEEPLAIGQALAIAAGKAPSEDSLEFLGDHLGLREELDLVLLSQIERVLVAHPGPSVDVRGAVRKKLWSEDGQVVRKAAEVVGRLEDFEAAPRLVELLESGREPIEVAALDGLRNLTGVDHGNDPGAWQAWLEREEAWFQAKAEGLFRIVDLGEDVHVGEALEKLAPHRYRRDEIARRVTVLLDHPQGAVRKAALRTLGRLGSRASVPHLLRALHDPEEELAQLALETLRSISPHVAPAEGRGPALDN